MSTLITPDVTALVVGHLDATLTGTFSDVYVGDNLATTNPWAVTVRRDGGEQQTRVTASARLGINVWGPTEKDANDLADEVVAQLNALRMTAPVIRLNASEPAEITDTTRLHRRYLTAAIVIRKLERS